MSYDEMDETQLVNLSELDDEPGPNDATLVGPAPSDPALDDTIVAPMPTEMAVAEEITGSTRLDPQPAAQDDVMVGETRLAHNSERFAAFLFDSYMLMLFYWGGVQAYHHFWKQQSLGLAPTNLSTEGLLFHGAFLIVAFLYYFLSEGTVSASPGKLLLGLAVRRTDGAVPSITAMLFRNLLRIVDYFPFILPGALGYIFIELTSYDQRLGDVVANTVCVKRHAHSRARRIDWERIAKPLGRLVAALVNFTTLSALLVGALLLLDDAAPHYSQWLLLAMPLYLGLVWIGAQQWSQTTPGGWLMGYRVVQEDGDNPQLAHTLLRNLLLPLDACGLGFIALIFSPRRQRVGDMMAGTLVVSAARSSRGLIAFVVMLLLSLGTGYMGMQNPDALYSSDGTRNLDFDWSFVPRTELLPHWPPTGAPTEPFMIKNFRFAEGNPLNTRSPATYVPGERAWFVFDVHGFTTRGRSVWIQEDLSIRYPDNSFGLRQENIIDYNQLKRNRGPLELKNDILIPEGFPPGRYTVFITVRDKYADDDAIVYNRDFYVKEK